MNSLETSLTSSEPDPSANVTRSNPPGLPTLAYRGGKYQTTLQNMLAQLSTRAALARLNRDANDDWSIALLHAWAIVTDVLAFYQERITNEGYLRTATDPRSILELARAIGYELAPGVAASAYLALTVLPDNQNQPQQLTVPQGNAVQSTPGEDELPQVFETSQATVVRTEWNLLKPFVSLDAAATGANEPIWTDVTTIRVAGVRNDLQPGDLILFVDKAIPAPAAPPTPGLTGSEQTVTATTDQTPPPVGGNPVRGEGLTGEGLTGEGLTGEGLTGEGLTGEGLTGEAGDVTENPPVAPPTPPEAWVLGTLTAVLADPQKIYTVIQWTVEDSAGAQIQKPALFVFRRQAALFGYAQGAVYYAPEEIPADVPAGATAGEPPPDANTPGGASPGGTAVPGEKAGPGSPTSGAGQPPIVDGSDSGNASPGNPAPVPPVPPQPKSVQWTPRTLSLPNLDINALVVNKQGVLFAGTKQDLYRSFDDGQSWQPASVEVTRRNITALALTDAARPDEVKLFAGSSTGGIYLSYDNGENWTAMSGDAVAPNATVEKQNENFKITFSQTLPKSPVRELETFTKPDKKVVLYAGTADGIFSSTDEGRTWKPEAIPTVVAVAQAGGAGAVAVDTTQTLLQPPALLKQIVPPLNKFLGATFKAVGLTQYVGADIWNFGLSFFRKTPSEAAVRTLAIDKSGKQPTVLVGTDAGKAQLKGNINRWWVAAAILGLVLLWNFLAGGPQPITNVKVTGQGKLKLDSTLTSSGPLTATIGFTATTGAASITPTLNLTDVFVAPITLDGRLVVSPKLVTTNTVTATAILTANLTEKSSDSESSEDERTPEKIALATNGTVFIRADTAFTTTLRMASNVTATGIITVAPNPLASGRQIVTVTLVAIAGTLTADDGGAGQGGGGSWFAKIWTPVVETVSSTIQQVSDTLTKYWQALQAQLPGPVKAGFAWIYANVWLRVLAPIFGFLQAYLLQPLLSTTAESLARLTLATLVVLILLVAWQYTDQSMSKRKTVKLDGPVNALVIRPNGQIFAGTEKGIYRTLEDDPEASLLARGARILVRALFKDKPLEPVNTGLTVLDTDKLPDVRALAISATGDLLAGTADGRLFRSSDNGDHWYRYDTGLTLKAVRTIVATPRGQFVTGAVGAGKVEEQWFTSQVTQGQIDLDAVYPNLPAGSWIVLSQPPLVQATSVSPMVNPAATQTTVEPSAPVPAARTQYVRYPIVAVDTVASQDFVTVGNFSRITIADGAGLPKFLRSKTKLWVQAEPVALFDSRPVKDSTFELDRYVPELGQGHVLIVTGKQMRALITEDLPQSLIADHDLDKQRLKKGDILQVSAPPVDGSAPGLWKWRLRTRDGFVGTIEATATQIRWVTPAEDDPDLSEVVVVQTAPATEQRTVVTVQSPLTRVYDRATFTVFGNVVHVTHGQTVKNEVLGSGSGMHAYERFMLQERPLTFVSAPTDRGLASTLDVRVNGITWHEVPYLYGLTRDSRSFIVRQDALFNTFIIFGDGKQGARLPTGTEQVTATYRIGIGPDGNVAAQTLDQLQNFPSAIQKATNPVPATGGIGPEAPEWARQRAPLSVRVLNRIVSLADYEDFVRLYAGIGRAQIKAFGLGPHRLLYMTIADRDGNVIPAMSDLYQNLKKGIDAHRALPIPPVQIASYEPLYFNLAAKLLIDPDAKGRVDAIEQVARQRLLTAFSFDQRDFGQDVAESEVIQLLQAIKDVIAVENVQLNLLDEDSEQNREDANELLIAQPARLEAGVLKPAQMLLLNTTSQGLTLCIATTAAPAQCLNHHEVSA